MTNSNCFNIAFDIDDVLIEFYLNFIKWYNKKFDTNFKFEDIVSYFLPEVLGISAKDVDLLVKEFYKTTSHSEIEEVQGAGEFLNFIQNFPMNLKILLITSRPLDIYLQTNIVLRRNFNKIRFSKIRMLGSYDYVNPNNYCKSDVCIDEEVNLIFEDSFSNAQKIASKGVPVVLFNKPWNISTGEEDHPLITRTNGFDGKIKKIFHYYRNCYADGHYFDSLIPYNLHFENVLC